MTENPALCAGYVCRAYTNTGTIHTDKGDYDTAIGLHTTALDIFLDVLGTHAHTAACYSSLGGWCRVGKVLYRVVLRLGID